jgi:hypothetical protein
VSPVRARPGDAARNLRVARESELGACWFSLCSLLLLLLLLLLEKAKVFLAIIEWKLFCVRDGSGNDASVLSFDKGEKKECQ